MPMTVRGAYGFRLSGLEAGTWLGVNEALHWPELSCKEDSRPEAPELLLDVHALELRVRADIAHSELVHPLLGRVASQVALAHGADAMHAGAVGWKRGCVGGHRAKRCGQEHPPCELERCRRADSHR